MRRVIHFLIILVLGLLLLEGISNLDTTKQVPGVCLGTISLLSDCIEAMQK